MRADALVARVLGAEGGFVEAATQHGQGFADRNPFRSASQDIAAGRAARARDQPAGAEHAQELGNIGLRDAFELADLGNGEAAALAAPSRVLRPRPPVGRLPPVLLAEAEQAAEPVFFLAGEFHACLPGLATNQCPTAAARPRTSCSAPRAAPRPNSAPPR